jgi:ABC-type multidrug transport system fused ATPase/permease subunit
MVVCLPVTLLYGALSLPCEWEHNNPKSFCRKVENGAHAGTRDVFVSGDGAAMMAPEPAPHGAEELLARLLNPMKSVIANPTDGLRPAAPSRSRGKVVLHVDSLRKHYGSNQAVAGVSFDLRQGEVFGLLGLNGAGKSTLISMLATLRRPSGGDALLLGAQHPHRMADDFRHIIGVEPQDNPDEGVLPSYRFRVHGGITVGVDWALYRTGAQEEATH